MTRYFRVFLIVLNLFYCKHLLSMLKFILSPDLVGFELRLSILSQDFILKLLTTCNPPFAFVRSTMVL